MFSIKAIKKTAVIMAAIMSAAMLLSGCKGTSTVDDDNALVNAIKDQDAANAAKQSDAVIHNFEMPEIGEKIAVITVKDYGDIKIKLFPEVASKGVENFTGLADMGYYDELIFHRIISNFMIQGGDPKGNGTGGKSIWGDQFDGGVPEGLYHFSGAVAYANSGSTSTDGSQFYIVNTPEGYLQNTCEELMQYDPSTYSWPQNVVEMYNEKGGTPFLDGSYTVFGQVFEGLDIVRELGNVETDSNDKPLKQVQMESVKIVDYEG